MSLILDVFTDYIRSDFVTCTADKVTIVPQFPTPKLFPYLRKLLEYLSGRDAFHYLYHSGRRVPRRYLNKYVNMVFHHFHGIYHPLIFLRYVLDYLFHILPYLSAQNILPVLQYPYQVILEPGFPIWAGLKPEVSPTQGSVSVLRPFVQINLSVLQQKMPVQ
jgi:hypothetical protein